MKLPRPGRARPSIASDKTASRGAKPRWARGHPDPWRLDFGPPPWRQLLDALSGKAFRAGLDGADSAAAGLGDAADGFVEHSIEEEKASLAEDDIGRGGRVAAVPAAVRARRDRARDHERRAADYRQQADAKRDAAVKLEDEEARLPGDQQSRAPVVSRTSVRISVKVRGGFDWVQVSLLGALLEGAFLLAPIIEQALDIRDPVRAVVSGVALSLIAAGAAIEQGRNLATDQRFPARWRRVLLIVIAVALAGAAIGLIVARGDVWWVGLAVVATWSAAGAAAYDLEHRLPGAALAARRAILLAEADRLDDLAEAELAKAAALRAEALAIETTSAGDAAALEVSSARSEAADRRAAAMKKALRGVIASEIELGRATREALAGDPGPDLALRRRVATAVSIVAVLATGVLAVLATDGRAAPAPSQQLVPMPHVLEEEDR